jgi:alcohol dehydrogenase (nicotinoprotein)
MTMVPFDVNREGPMKTKAAILRGAGQDFEIAELDLDGPKTGEVLIRYVAAGLCHSDEHLRNGDLTPRFPIVGGHEGAGIIEEVGPGVTRLAPGDHVICSFLPVCGHCRWCSTGKSNLCDMGATILDGCLPDGTYRFHLDGEDLGAMCMLGTFSERSVISENSVIKVDPDVPLDKVVLIGCGVPTGFGSAVHAAATEPGDTIAIYGIGGIGINAVQGAALAGARNVVAIDPLANKREMAEKLGATHSAETAEEAQLLITELTRGVGADKAIVTVGVVDSEVVTNAFNAIRKGGTVVVTGLADPAKTTIELSGAILTLFEKRIQGSLFGSGDPFHDIPRMVELYQSGDLKLDELITTTYTLDEINQGYQDLLDGKNIRGVIRYADA